MSTDPQQPPESVDMPTAAAARAQSLEDVAELLRMVRRRHARTVRGSSLTYLELAQRTGWSQAAIAEYFTARTLPPTDRFDALLEVLGAAPAELRAFADARDRVEENLRRAKTRRRTEPADPAGPAEPFEPPESGPGSVTPRASTSGAPTPPPPPPPTPRQLPADTSLFTGREKELSQLLDLAGRTGTGMAPGAAMICTIDGMGGIGKTALAVHAGHRLAERFPDGQLFVDLHGFTEGAAPQEPGEALAGLLGALGVPPGQVPAQADARAALYRERLADTRTLVVLANAFDEAQVHPLLPAAAGCLVLVTSRRRLKALDDAAPLPLDVLAPDEAAAVLRRAARAHGDPADDARWEPVAALCGRLPLALVIAGAVLRVGGKAWDLARLVDRLGARRPEDQLAGYTDDARSLAAVFDLSYRSLPPDEQRLFRRLGLLAGSEIDAYAAAALLDAELDTADLLVQRLADHSLLTGASPGRYRVHDLIRAHAGTLAAAVDPAPERETAYSRLLHYWAHTAQRASLPLARWPRPAPTEPAPAQAPDVIRQDAAWAWLRAERRNLDAAFTHASTHGLDQHAIALAAGLAEILRVDGPWAHAQHVHHTAAQIADRLDRPADHAAALTELGRACHLSSSFAQARESHAQALDIYRALGDRQGEATALNDLGRVRSLTGDLQGAADAHTRALEIHRGLGNRYGEAGALADLGRARRLTGDFPGAVAAAERTLEIYRDLGDRQGEAGVLTNLGRVRYLIGDFPGAVAASSRALETYRALADRRGEGTALNDLGRVHFSLGDHPQAAEAHRRALEIFRTLGSRDNEAVALNDYAGALAATGRRPQALALYQQALAMHRELHKTDDEAVSLEGIGEHYLATEDPEQGCDHLRQALEIHRRLGSRANAERVQARLAETAG